MKIIRKLSLQLIVLQLLALLFFEEAFFQFYYYLHADLYECTLRNGGHFLHECFERYESPGVTPAYLLTQSFYALFYGVFFGLFLTAIVNWKRKRSLWNTALIVVLYFVFLVVGAFKGRLIHELINSFAALFSSKIGISCLIASQVALIVGILLVWLSVTNFTRAKER